jgi:hypothetical protein
MRPLPKREVVELVDGSTYWSDDNWVTVWGRLRKGSRAYKQTKETSDRIRFIAVCQHGGGRNDEGSN